MKKLLIFFVALSLLLACGCSNNNESEIPIGNESPGNNKPSVNGEIDILELGNKDDAKYLIQIDINPSVIVGYESNQNVVYLASNNKDGYNLLKKHDAEKIFGEPVNAAVGSIMTAAYNDGYASENFDVKINFISEEKADIEELMQITRAAVETCDFDIKATVENESEIDYSPENGISEKNTTDTSANKCDICNGKGFITCSNCNGKGEAIVIVEREIEVRNDYVCEICGGSGWIDDGMHGGEKGNCDSCGGAEGKMPSADFKALAYDIEIIEEEEMRFCEPCAGSGETECSKCHGTGELN